MFTLTITWVTFWILYVLGVIGSVILQMQPGAYTLGDLIIVGTQALAWPLAIPGIPITLVILIVFGWFFNPDGDEEDLK